MAMPGGQHPVAVTASPGLGTSRKGGSTARAVLVRALAVLAVAAAVGVLAGMSAWSAGRASVDRDELIAQGRAAGRAQVLARVNHDGAAERNIEARYAPGGSGYEKIYRRGWRAGTREARSQTAFESRAHGRLLGAKAAMGGFAWESGSWYLVQAGSGGDLTGDQPAVHRRVGPLTGGTQYALCGGRICRSGAPKQ